MGKFGLILHFSHHLPYFFTSDITSFSDNNVKYNSSWCHTDILPRRNDQRHFYLFCSPATQKLSEMVESWQYFAILILSHWSLRTLNSKPSKKGSSVLIICLEPGREPDSPAQVDGALLQSLACSEMRKKARRALSNKIQLLQRRKTL